MINVRISLIKFLIWVPNGELQNFELFVAVEALESFFSLYGTPHFCVTQSTFQKTLWAFGGISPSRNAKTNSNKSHKTNSSCESQSQRELLVYESMEVITFVTY